MSILQADQLNTKNVAHGKKKLTVIVAVVLVIALAIGLTSALLITGQNSSISQTGNQNSQTRTQTTPQSWIKVGAYATYEGQVTILSMNVSFNAKMEIVNLNQTHIEVATDFNMSTPYGATENSTTLG